MKCGKLYKWTEMKTRDIPLPQIAREILECGSDKVFEYHYNNDDDFDVIVGCKKKEDAIKVESNNLDEENIEEMKPAKWFLNEGIKPRVWNWTSDSTKKLPIAEIALTITKYQTSNVYQRFYESWDDQKPIEQEKDDFEIIIGARSKEEAVNIAAIFALLRLEGSMEDPYTYCSRNEFFNDYLKMEEPIISLWV